MLQCMRDGRVRGYILISATLLLVGLVLRAGTWQHGNAHLHTLLEVTATLIAALTGATALVRYYARGHRTILYLGVGFCGTAILDAYHAVVTSTIVTTDFPSPQESLAPWSWSASRMFLALLMVISWWTSRDEEVVHRRPAVEDLRVYAGFGVLVLISFSVFAFLPLGQAYFPGLPFGRPQEFVPALIFLIALLGYLARMRWQTDSLDHWIVVSLLIGFAAQTLFMSRSFRLFDGMFDLAHLLKILSYLAVFSGLLSEMHSSWRHELELMQERAEELKRTQRLLDVAWRVTGTEAHLSSVEGPGTPLLEISETPEERQPQNAFEHAMSEFARMARRLGNAPIAMVGYMPVRETDPDIIAVSEISDLHDSHHADAVTLARMVHVWLSESARPFRVSGDLARPDTLMIEELSETVGVDPLKNTDSSEVLADTLALVVPIPGSSGGPRGFAVVFGPTPAVYALSDLFALLQIVQLMTPAWSLQAANEVEAQRSAELNEAREAAERSNVDLRQFAFVASHDLQSPLRSVVAQIDSLREELGNDLGDTAERRLSAVVELCTQMQRLVQDLLKLAMIESHGGNLEEVDLNTVVSEVRMLLQADIQETGCTIVTRNLPRIVADRSQMIQLLQNLIGNAIKYRSERVPEIEIAAHQVPDGWAVRVRDNGIGIRKRHLKRIFEAFRRLHSQDEYPGSGIGLAACRRIVEGHGGRIHAESVVGEGSTFEFIIPHRHPALKKQIAAG